MAATEAIGPRLEYGRELEERITATLAPLPATQGAQLTVQRAYAANPGTGRERVHPQPMGPPLVQAWSSARERLTAKCGV